jgi:DNA-binding HxlR family transcriptional regulator
MSTIPSASAAGRVLVPEAWPREVTALPADTAVAASAGAEPAAATPSSADPTGATKPRSPRVLSPVETTAALLRGRYTAVVIWHLFWGGKRFYQLVRELDGVPRKAIAHELEELERAGIVRRTTGRGPAKVEYQLTADGEGLKVVVGAMYEWGLRMRASAPPPELPPH